MWCRGACRGDFEANDQEHLALISLDTNRLEEIVLSFVQLQPGMRAHAVRVKSVLDRQSDLMDLFSSELAMEHVDCIRKLARGRRAAQLDLKPSSGLTIKT